ncbi:tetratricopeptide repeat-containing glycosyltransferase family 2 protein [Paenibacillus sedimenti]|uniref:Glycosyltransferase family 2 protein n=1 Tax=Paenibacillus sedimenti TaxID=2770274 RepID=A0A926KR69_9BACL|nr:glycosyltransferase family 2 protein [Paenibacillus sedimenti]MBD0382455.1 glycosyltransferase family 2 protein [Paenibacillus sedimenti]
MNNPQITACIIVKNAEATLSQAITSVRKHVDEIIVVDTGSQDASQHIARQLDANVHHFLWNDHFAEARNYALSLTTSEWVLMIDADEEFIWHDPLPLNKWIVANGAPHTVYLLPIHHLDLSGNRIQASTHVERLFQPANYAYKGRIHETLYPLHGARVSALSDRGGFLHTGYAPTVLVQKQARNLRLLELEHQEFPYEGRVHRYLAAERFNQSRYVLAVQHASQALELLPVHDTYPRAQAHYYLMMSYLLMEDTAKAKAAALRCSEELPEYSDTYAVLAECDFLIKSWTSSLFWFRKWRTCLTGSYLFPNHFSGAVDDLLLRAADAWVQVGDDQEAIELLVTAYLRGSKKAEAAERLHLFFDHLDWIDD